MMENISSQIVEDIKLSSRNIKDNMSESVIEANKLNELNETQMQLQGEILSKILVDTKIQIRKGFKVVLEDLIILSIWTSCIFKMNLQSFLDISLVIMFFVRRTQRVMLFILSMNSLIFILRIGLIVSNMDS
jgi:hypothetical protein